MIGKSLDDMKGNCTIEKSFIWNINEISGGAQWEQIPLDGRFTQEILSKGFVLKVTSDCKLGTSEQVTAPPILP
jgi:hypothetical protein